MIKQRTRQYIIYFVFLILGVFCGNWIFKTCLSSKPQLVELEKTQKKEVDLSNTNQWKDKYNQLHIVLEKEQLSKEVFQNRVDSMSKLLDIKTKQINQITHIKQGLNIKRKLNTDIIYDTVFIDGESKVNQITNFNYSDRWIDIRGNIGRSDSIYIKGVDTLIRTDYWKRSWLLGKKKHYVDFVNKNPYFEIQGLKEIELKKESSKWSVGPSIGIGVVYGQKIEFRPIVGLSLQYKLIEF